MKFGIGKLVKKIVCLALVIALSLGVLCGCNTGNKTSDNVLRFVMQGKDGNNYDEIVTRMNEILLEKTGYTVEFEMVTQENYDLVIGSGEEIDLVYAPDWLNYWQNASKGAFMEITDEDLKQYAPYYWENGGLAKDLTKYKGQRFSFGAIMNTAADRCIAARGDLMDKYGIKDLNSLENIEKYLTAVAENEKDIIPFNVQGGIPWQMFALLAGDAKWAPIGSVSYGGHIYFNIDDPEHKLFIAAEQPELLEFTKMMKRWNDKGFFSKSVMSNKTGSDVAFKAGTSALAFVNNPAACQTMWDEFQKDDRKAWDVRFFPRYQVSQLVNNITATMVAIGATSKKKEACLKVIDEFYKNEELYRLISFGIEGDNYEIDSEGNYKKLGDESEKGWLSIGVKNGSFDFVAKYNFPGHEELVKHLYEIRDDVPAVNMPKDLTKVRNIELALSEVYNQFSAPRCYGVFEGSAEDALKMEVEKLKAAGIDEYLVEMQAQLDAYYEGIK